MPSPWRRAAHVRLLSLGSCSWPGQAPVSRALAHQCSVQEGPQPGRYRALLAPWPHGHGAESAAGGHKATSAGGSCLVKPLELLEYPFVVSTGDVLREDKKPFPHAHTGSSHSACTRLSATAQLSHRCSPTTTSSLPLLTATDRPLCRSPRSRHSLYISNSQTGISEAAAQRSELTSCA